MNEATFIQRFDGMYWGGRLEAAKLFIDTVDVMDCRADELMHMTQCWSGVYIAADILIRSRT